MNTPPIPRWRIGFIARRWRYLFVAVLLLVTLLGALYEWQRYERGKEACVVLKVDNGIVAPALWREMIPDDLLQEASRATSFPALQGVDSVTSLRRMIRFEVSRDGSLVSISLKGGNEPAKTGFCNEVGEMISKRAYRRLQEAYEANDRWTATAVIANAQKRLREARDHLEHLCETTGDSETLTGSQRAALLIAKADYRDRSRELAAALLLEKASPTRCFLPPVSIHQRAALPAPFSVADLYQPAASWSLWIAAAFLIATTVIYLAECLLPRPPPP